MTSAEISRQIEFIDVSIRLCTEQLRALKTARMSQRMRISAQTRVSNERQALRAERADLGSKRGETADSAFARIAGALDMSFA